MKFYNNLFALASCLSPVCVVAITKNVHVDVAVIGGGSSGIHAAINLKDAGAAVAVIEKKDQIGGHAEIYINPKTKVPANIGAVLFENTNTVHKYLSRLGVAVAKHNPFKATPSTKMYDFTLGVPVPAQDEAEAAATKKAMAAAMQTYSQNVLSKYPWIDQGYHVPDPVPEELLLPFGQFAQQNNFSAILPLISQLNCEFLVAASGDTRSIYKAASAVLGNDIYLSSDIVRVQRNRQGAAVTIRQKRESFTIKAKKLVVAIPQTIENMRAFDLSEMERKLFSKLSAFGYVAGVADIPGLDVSLQNVGIMTPAKTPMIPGSNAYLSSGSPNQFLLGVAFDNTDYTVADSKSLIRKELTTLARAGAVPADTAKRVTFPYISNHVPYDLHVTGEDIEKGFYTELLKLEGYLNTYWTGAAFAGHNSGLIWKWNDGTVLPALKKDLGI
ncbi:hypothetical protein NOF04DRAFT_1363469 [Fusarium oxysporum II5]|uniref:Amine oxidase domain-containing protein n=5 Tax=Fusarium oxysporum species complex TaxID=171631 RepID=N1S4G2_FUSC4|nr:hypothetical protein FOC4_g10001849 [Fusarium odoratissimum]ENH71637.1 hypothetical protein FOC1_g10001189 [Fusarium oxysporum f. sp. cubense race 1]KAK2122343.1 hypothetical protein NOF04DRAFT_1363469 [Fusarium oxysporum II5]PCD22327.1 hypothetical protein AU210_016116 [Fusarium oxysporum f. sp. radicis-cucumerinum]TVY73717.1 Beta-cyclopiazonate dehydrogenase [Fusarium oxysporum f. sp. cubense]